MSAGYQASELVIRSSGMQFRPLDDVLPTEILQSSRDRWEKTDRRHQSRARAKFPYSKGERGIGGRPKSDSSSLGSLLVTCSAPETLLSRSK